MNKSCWCLRRIALVTTRSENAVSKGQALQWREYRTVVDDGKVRLMFQKKAVLRHHSSEEFQISFLTVRILRIVLILFKVT